MNYTYICEVRLKFVNQYLQRMHVGIQTPHFSRLAMKRSSFLWICGLNRLKSAGNPILIYREPITYIMVGVWSAKTTRRIIVNIFFSEIINSHQ